MVSRFFNRLSIGAEPKSVQRHRDSSSIADNDDADVDGFVIVDDIPGRQGVSKAIEGDIPPTYSTLVEESRSTNTSETSPPTTANAAENSLSNFLQGVPFQLSPTLTHKDSVKVILAQVDTAIRNLSSIKTTDSNYNFLTENTFLEEIRNILN